MEEPAANMGSTEDRSRLYCPEADFKSKIPQPQAWAIY